MTGALTRAMYDLDTLEAINVDQLVTATDWLLLRGMRKQRPMRAASHHLHYAPTLHVRRTPARSRGVVAIVATGLVAAYASLAIAVACLLA